jgi:polypeptide N-acetylgalactosaminyltransferase
LWQVWLFGGEVVTVPCSRAGHFEAAGSRAYRDNFTNVIQTNYKRIVDVWFDEYGRYFYLHNPNLAVKN